MAEQLGQAELILTLNDDALRTGLRQLQQDLQNLNTEVRPRLSTTGGGSSRSNTTNITRGQSTPIGDLGRQVQAARDLNLNTNWGVALRTLGEIDADLALIGASQELNLRQGWTVALQQLSEVAQDLAAIETGRDFNIQSSWRTALSQLSEIDADLRQVAAGDRLNLNSSWTQALTQLAEVNEDLRLISSAERLNLNASWTQALTQLQDIDADLRLISAGENLNLNTSWTAALSDLQDIKADLDLVAAGRDLNLRTSWQNFLQQLEEVKADLDASSRQQANTQTKDTIRGRIEENRRNPSGFGDASRDNFGPSNDTRRDQLDDDLARVRAARIKAEQDAANAAARTAAAERRAAKEALDAATARRNRRNETLSNALIGGAFPLLFGQGLGASIGGGVGGAAGGQLGGQFGFGLSLIGTAVGQQFDVAIQKVQLLGEALDDPIAKFSELADAGLISSKSQEKLIQNLISVGREAEAQALLQQDLAASFGDLSSAKELAEATDELYRAFAQLSTLLAQLAGPILTGVINSFSGLLRKYAQILLLSPDRVQARERQATDVVESQTTPLQRTGFFGPVNVKFNGKTYKGSAAGVREQIIRELLQQEFDNFTSGAGEGGSNVNAKDLQKVLDLRKQIKDLAFEQIQADANGNRTESLRLQRLQVELNLQKELGKYNDKNDPGGVLREEARARAAEKLAKIDAELRNRPAAGSFGAVNEELGFLEQLRNRLPAASEGFRAVDAAIVRTKDALGQLEAAAGQVRFENIQQALDTKSIARSFVNLQSQLQAAQQVIDNFNWDSLEVDPTAADKAIRQLAAVQDAIDKVENAKATITVRVIGEDIAAGKIANSLANVNRQLQAAQKAVETFNWDNLLLDPAAADRVISDLTRVQDRVRDLDKRKAEVTVRVIGAQIANGEIARSFTNLRDQLNAAQTVVDNFDFNSLSVGAELAQQAQNEIRKLKGLPPLPFKVGREGLTAALTDLVSIQDQVDRIDGLKATIEVEVLQTGIDTGSITNSIANQRRVQQAALTAFEVAPIGSQQAKQAADAYLKATDVLEQARKLIAETPNQLRERQQNEAQTSFDAAQQAQTDAASKVQAAFDQLRASTEAVVQAQASLRSALEGSFDLLTSERKAQLTDAARRDVQQAVDAGFFDRGAVSGLSGKELLSAASQARGVLTANDNISKATTQLVESNAVLAQRQGELIKANETLAKATAALAEKTWAVNVNVPGGSASGDVVSAVNSRT